MPFQIPKKIGRPKPAHSEGSHEVDPVFPPGTWRPKGQDLVIEVDQMHDQKQPGENGKNAGVALTVAHQEQEKWDGEVHQKNGPGESLPAPGHLWDVPYHVIRKVGDPDKHELE